MRLGDARRLPIKSGTIDCVISSPPYLNAIDYLRGHKFSLIWMGHSVSDLRTVRATNVGTEVSAPSTSIENWVSKIVAKMGETDRLPSRELGMLRRYVIDMDAAVSEIARVLTPSGRAVLVVGDSNLRSIFVRNSAALLALGRRHGLRLHSTKRRALAIRRRYLPPPTTRKAGARLRARMHEEVILMLTNS
jgi:hypothetical protein